MTEFISRYELWDNLNGGSLKPGTNPDELNEPVPFDARVDACIRKCQVVTREDICREFSKALKEKCNVNISVEDFRSAVDEIETE